LRVFHRQPIFDPGDEAMDTRAHNGLDVVLALLVIDSSSEQDDAMVDHDVDVASARCGRDIEAFANRLQPTSKIAIGRHGAKLVAPDRRWVAARLDQVMAARTAAVLPAEDLAESPEEAQAAAVQEPDPARAAAA